MADDGRASQRAVEHVPASFYQALRRVECAHRQLPRLGRAAEPASEPVRLGQEPTVTFEPAPFLRQHEGPEGVQRLAVSFFGVFGANGPLPLHLSEYARQRMHGHRDATFARFVDIFHHRLLTLFYRAWADGQPTVSHDRPDDDRMARYLSALAGQPFDDGHDEGARGARRMAHHFVGRTRHAEGLAKTLADQFAVKVAIEEFVEDWLPIPEEYCWRLHGGGPSAQAALGELGTSSRIGTEVLERQFKFRVVLGPMSRAMYERFLPRGDLLPRLEAMVTRYAGSELSWDVRLELDTADFQATLLGQAGRLGQTSYIGDPAQCAPRSRDPLVLDPRSAAVS